MILALLDIPSWAKTHELRLVSSPPGSFKRIGEGSEICLFAGEILSQKLDNVDHRDDLGVLSNLGVIILRSCSSSWNGACGSGDKDRLDCVGSSTSVANVQAYMLLLRCSLSRLTSSSSDKVKASIFSDVSMIALSLISPQLTKDTQSRGMFPWSTDRSVSSPSNTASFRYEISSSDFHTFSSGSAALNPDILFIITLKLGAR
mmetsp:Transcript_11036/g.16577  ORF Transcript_11036/g.16577 Transcript_11036/m.16577 type:complete len:203 (+) Transcript_11036:1586-2194(+)